MVGFILCSFLLLSMAVLPKNVTRRAYLNIVLLVSIMILELGFIIPLADQPSQCHDPVTPNGMHSSLDCAFSGAFVTFGLVSYVLWILVRAIFMHLQICWHFTPDKVSYVVANGVAWSVAVGLVSAALAKAGVSFRFGGYCLVNVGSLSTYWGWLLGFGGLALFIQLATFGYCLKIYLSAAVHLRNDPRMRSASIASSSRSRNARAAIKRINEVLLLQWRSLTLIALAIMTTAFVCIVFVVFDDKLTQQAFANTDALIPWILCLITTQDKNQCLNLTGPIIISENLAVATLYILAIVGIEAFILLIRFELFVAWFDLLRKPFRKNTGNSDNLTSDLGSKKRGPFEGSTLMSDASRSNAIPEKEMEGPKGELKRAKGETV